MKSALLCCLLLLLALLPVAGGAQQPFTVSLYDAEPSAVPFEAALGISLDTLKADWLAMVDEQPLRTPDEMAAMGVQ